MMRWQKVALRNDRKEPYHDAILMSISEAGGRVTREQLIGKVTEMLQEFSDMGNIAWHMDRMVAAMVRDGRLRCDAGEIRLATSPGSQQSR